MSNHHFPLRRRSLPLYLAGSIAAILMQPIMAGITLTGTNNPLTNSGADPWNVGGTLTIGDGANGTMTINGSSTVSNTTGVVGDAAVGGVTVSGAGAMWTNSGSLTLGDDAGTGSLDILDGGVVDSLSSTVGGISGLSGIANVTGSGSTWTAGNLHVRRGTLNILDGGVVHGGGRIANSPGGFGNVTVEGVGSTWYAGALILGFSGVTPATLNINSGGFVSAVALDGGVGIFGNPGPQFVNFDGGTLKIAPTNTMNGADTTEIEPTLNAGGGTLEISNENYYDSSTDPYTYLTTTFTVTSRIVGVGALTKTGPGILELQNNNLYGGSTLVSEGTLLANNTAGSATSGGSVTVSAGATLGGTGSVDGLVTVNAGGFLAPGASIESLSVGSATGAGTYLFEYDGSAVTPIDFLSVLTSLDITSATLDFDQTGSSLTAPHYILASYGTLTGNFASVVDLPAGYVLDYNYQSLNQIALVVPEPGSTLLTGLAVFGFLRRRGRASLPGTLKKRDLGAGEWRRLPGLVQWLSRGKHGQAKAMPVLRGGRHE